MKWLLAILLVLASLALFSRPPGPLHFALAGARASGACAAPMVRFRGAGKDFPALCRSAEAAIAFLSGLGLALRHPVQIDIVPVLSCTNRNECLGCFSASRDRIEILDLTARNQGAFRRRIFGFDVDAELLGSVVGHEIAHAALHDAPEKHGRPLPRGFQEYIAHVTQLSLLGDQRRKRVLERYGDAAFTGPEQMTAIFYQIDPEKFAVMSYRHFLATADRKAFIRRLVEGKESPYELYFR